MFSSNCNSAAAAHFGAPHRFYNAVADQQLAASAMLHPQQSPESLNFQCSMSTPPTEKPCEPRRTSNQSQLTNFFVESQYLQSVSARDKCAGQCASWKSGFSQTNRFLWTETLKLAIRDLLTSEASSGAGKFIDDEGVHRYAELVEWAIFQYLARDPMEYGNEMAAKYDSIRGGDFTKEESVLLHHYAWL